MATNKRVFTLRLEDDVFDKIGILATSEHRSITNYIEYVLLKHITEVEQEKGKIGLNTENEEETLGPLKCPSVSLRYS